MEADRLVIATMVTEADRRPGGVNHGCKTQAAGVFGEPGA